MAERIFACPWEATALGRFDSRPYRDDLEVGSRQVKFVVRCTADVTVEPDYKQLFITTDDYLRMLHLSGFRTNPERLGELVRRSQSEAIDARALKRTADDLKKCFEAHKQKTACRGRVKASATFSRLAR